ncbi:TPA: ATP-binding protein [Proteus mirabilis]|uniref:AAA family ATPase n=6 Tax=Proteus mirabilis TaxID=584 RepID=UPI0008F859E8|nr:ATP-binding protein [Proteus mirabilis]MCD4591253.1 ATP-binding protein [Proteus mirabilis]MCD4600781.1 ATP-binding protein [Proteus mirabilis]MCD4605248.1 ATP-binding protein [Proteus mirabilis]MCD4608476.1 ATP-binding protein [Proteus mirabilis]MCD4612547.1 ATP-binding protein [Proteus mirabilis]
MAIGSLSRSEFVERLYKVVRPSSPIDTPEFLFGRNQQISSITDALMAPGRHSFIYGSRGVGKSSLAHSVAFQLQDETNPILLSCSPSSTLESIVSEALKRASSELESKSDWTASVSIGIAGNGFKFERKSTKETKHIEIYDVSSAVFALQHLEKIHSKIPYIVIDEFDRIDSSEEREKFGTLLKQLGDMRCKVKIIFTGIADSFQEILCGHASSARQIHELKLEPLPWDGRARIIERAFEEFNIFVPEDIKFRISGLSDGFPHYVHIICEKILYALYDKENDIKEVDYPLFIQGLDDAVKSVEQSLKVSYNHATEARDAQYAYVLWSVADSADLQRKKADILQSYQDVCEQLKITPLNDTSFSRILSLLKKNEYGEVVVPAFPGKRSGWYKFNENMLRGYVRMHAEVRGIQLDFQKNFTSNEPTANSRVKNRFNKTISQVEREVDYERRRNQETLKELSREYARRNKP